MFRMASVLLRNVISKAFSFSGLQLSHLQNKRTRNFRSLSFPLSLRIFLLCAPVQSSLYQVLEDSLWLHLCEHCVRNKE